jgi:peptidoglycan/LPS O-acetylase OafA/YrhL
MPVPPAKPSVVYYPELDILRLLAFFLVFIRHSSDPNSWSPFAMELASCSGAGLQLFFLLSAYLITELLLAEKERTHSVHIKSFFVRRLLRIWPLYFAAIFTAYASTKLAHAGNFGTSALLSFIFLSGNWYVYSHGFLSSMASPLWSISIEEQYYAIWPFIMRAWSKSGIWAAAVVAIIAAYVALIYSGDRMLPRYAVWSSSLVEFQFFAVGAILALLLHGKEPHFRSSVRILLALATACMFALADLRYQIYAIFRLPRPNLSRAIFSLPLGPLPCSWHFGECESRDMGGPCFTWGGSPTGSMSFTTFRCP